MDRDILKKHLAMAERHVTKGERHISRQRELVSRLMLGGNADLIANAKWLLLQFEDLQTLHVADRDRLRSELTKSHD